MQYDDKYARAAIVLQTYFRMWKAQAQLLTLQLNKSQTNTLKLDHSQQVGLISITATLFTVLCKDNQ